MLNDFMIFKTVCCRNIHNILNVVFFYINFSSWLEYNLLLELQDVKKYELHNIEERCY